MYSQKQQVLGSVIAPETGRYQEAKSEFVTLAHGLMRAVNQVMCISHIRGSVRQVYLI